MELPRQAYTPWHRRAVAWVIDRVPVVVIVVLADQLPFGDKGEGCVKSSSKYARDDLCIAPETTAGRAYLMAGLVLALAFMVWNIGYRQGTTGSSLGKSVMKFQVVDEATGQPVGFFMSVVRQFAHLLDGFPFAGYLRPLWNAKRQTNADKVMDTVCVPLDQGQARIGLAPDGGH